MLRQVCSLVIASGFILMAALLARDASAASTGCIQYDLSPGYHVSGVTVVNHCDAPKLVGICARMEGRTSDLTQGQRIEANRSFRFEFVNFDDAPFAYRLQYCDPGSTTRMDLCIPQCPALQQRSPGNSGNSANVGNTGNPAAATVLKKVTCKCADTSATMSRMVEMPAGLSPYAMQERAQGYCLNFTRLSCYPH